MPITDFEPKVLWTLFNDLRQIPRCSGHEEKAGNWVLDWAKERGFEANRDDAGNVVVKVPATSGHEKAPVVAIQGHLDMVCEKNSDVDHDFSKDPIELVIDGEWLRANGTTLGSDNGVGLVAGMAVVDDPDVVHGPLELICTVDEERGLVGAGKLEPGSVSAKILLNLDSEELGSVFIGCAGGGDTRVTLPVPRTKPKGGQAARVTVSGLRGGHSGLDIIEQRGNAIRILARVLSEADAAAPLGVASFEGGNAHNAIPREAHATVVGNAAAIDALGTKAAELEPIVFGELGGKEEGLKIAVAPENDVPSGVFDRDAQGRLLQLLAVLPHGVEAMSYDIPDLVETSNNLATVRTGDKDVAIQLQARSSINSALADFRARIRAAGELAGASVDEDTPYPGWKPNLESKLLQVVKAEHKKLFGKEPEALAIHAGLECGIIGEKFPGMDMISFGPEIRHPHSPDEQINIPSVEKFWKLLAAVVRALA
jgi:dipeptidase D